jgi:hypothetical protein
MQQISPYRPESVSNLAVPQSPDGQAVIGGLRSIAITLVLTLGAIVLMYSLWSSLGYKMLMLGLGWPHVILGFLFYFGGIVRGDARIRIAFLLLVLLTLAIWTTHYFYDIASLIYIYFLYHAFRDDILVSVWKGAQRGRLSHLLDAAAIALALLLLGFLILASSQDAYRQLRSVEVRGDQFSRDSWSLISFDPIANSRGREFYFSLQAPNTAGQRAFITQAATSDKRSDGEIRVNDAQWSNASDLIFKPYYADDASTVARPDDAPDQIPVLLTGGHRVGQTFTADRDNLAGIWLPVDRLNNEGETTRFVFRMSAPLFAYPFTQTNLRWAGIILLGSLLVASLLLRPRKSQVWVYVLCSIAVFIGLQSVFKTSNLAERSLRFFSEFVLVFHYFLWYVITFHKYRGRSGSPGDAVPHNYYDRVLSYLRRTPQFPIAVVVLNLASLAGVAWYYQSNASPRLLYFFDYRFFLYFLAFHVTFSFKPTFLKSRVQKSQIRMAFNSN